MPLDYLFAPEDGQSYFLEDKYRAFAQQPLEGPSLPEYLIPLKPASLKPPTLLYGWMLGHDRLMQLALDHFSRVVRHRHGPPTVGLFDDEVETHYTEKDWQRVSPNIADTIFEDDFTIAIREYSSIGPEDNDLFTVDVLYDSQRQCEYGLTVGSNYLKVIDQASLQKLQALIGSDEPATWYCHYSKWMWRRVLSKAQRQAMEAKIKPPIVDPEVTITQDVVIRSVS